jgi:hypothetical protein
MSRIKYNDGWIYAVGEDNTPLVKIGYTHWVQCRLYGLRSRLKVPLTLLASVYVERCVPQVERHVHALLGAERIEGEWFYLYMGQEYLERLVGQAVTEVRGRQHGLSGRAL